MDIVRIHHECEGVSDDTVSITQGLRRDDKGKVFFLTYPHTNKFLFLLIIQYPIYIDRKCLKNFLIT